MNKQFAALWTTILMLCLGVIAFLITGMRQPSPATTEAAQPQATVPPQSLLLAPTRFLPTVAPEQPTPMAPLMNAANTLSEASIAVAQTATPRVLQLYRSLPSEFMLTRYCDNLGLPVSMRIFDWNTGNTISLNEPAVAQLPLSWDAQNNLWQGYDNPRPFNQPTDTQVRWKITLFLPDSTERWVEVWASPSTPDVQYIYAFQNLTPFADRNGNHFGYHPCRAFAFPTVQFDAFMTNVAQYQDVVRYPSFINGSDPRWTLGVVRPVAAYADLRSIPSVSYNVPIAGISREMGVWYATDPSWGQWAQIKLGAVQGWVDTGLVTLTPREQSQ